MIRQTTGEDWTDSKISLSTAVPSAGGNVPELNTENARIKPKILIQPRYLMKSSMPKREMSRKRLENYDYKLANFLIFLNNFLERSSLNCHGIY
jgi:hypothetical protein